MIFKLLKRFALIFLMAFALTQTSQAQLLTDFIFSYSTGSYSPYAGGTVLYSTNDYYWSGDYYKSTTIPFPFTFDGVVYTQCNVADIGMVSFRPPYTYDGLWQAPTSVSSMNQANPAIYAYGGGLCFLTATGWGYPPNGAMTKHVTGSAPYQVCSFQWTNMCGRYYWGPNPTKRWTFRINLYESTNKIEIEYGDRIWNGTLFTACVGCAGQIGSNRYQNVNPDGAGNFTSLTNNSGLLFNSYAKFLSITSGMKFKWARPEITSIYPPNNAGFARNIVIPALGNFGVKISRPAGMTHYIQYEVTGPRESNPSQIVYTAWDPGNQPNIYLPANCNTDPGGVPDYFFLNATGFMAANPGVNGDFNTEVGS